MGSYYTNFPAKYSHFPYFCQFELVSSVPGFMTTQSSPKSTERLRMRPWLEQRLQDGGTPGLEWMDREKSTFRISWKHAARHGWDKDKDACLFMDWAIHTSKFDPSKGDKPRPKTWKANFRCALNSLPDIQELPKMSNRRGNDAFKVYKLLPRRQTERKRKLGSQTKYRRSSTRINERANQNLKTNKQKENSIDHCSRIRTRSVSREANRKDSYTPKEEIQKNDSYTDSTEVKLEIDPDDGKTCITYNTHTSIYPTPPQSANCCDSPIDSASYRHSPTNTISGFAPPSIPAPIMSTLPLTMATSSPSSEVETKNLDNTFDDQSMHIDDDGSSSTSSVPTDEELVEMVHEMRNESAPNSPSGGMCHELLTELKPDDTTWTPSTDGTKFYLKNETGSMVTVSSLLDTSNVLTTLDTTAAALQLTESWIEQIGSNQEVTIETEELPILTEIPRPTYIKEPGDMKEYDGIYI
ncbi:uncharacterized protein LOC144452011 isoform X2 [Glandiceps talaboti]